MQKNLDLDWHICNKRRNRSQDMHKQLILKSSPGILNLIVCKLQYVGEMANKIAASHLRQQGQKISIISNFLHLLTRPGKD